MFPLQLELPVMIICQMSNSQWQSAGKFYVAQFLPVDKGS